MLSSYRFVRCVPSAVLEMNRVMFSRTSAASTTSASQFDKRRAEFFKPKTSPMLPKGTFDGKIAFVTGGGTGLGAGMVSLLSELGAQVAIASRKIDVLQKTADEISMKTGNTVLPLQCDVRDAGSVREAVSDCIEKLGLPTIVINNAAGNFIAPTERLSANAWKTIIDIVLIGTINVTVDIAKRLIAADEGASFLSISTTYTESGSGFVVPSACAKSAVEALTKSLASEWSVHGMRFNCISPGAIYTPGAFNRLDPTGNFQKVMKSRIPLGRFGEIKELANLAAYLVSDYSSWMTGTIVKLDGGEFNYCAGEFNELTKMSKEEWDMIENAVRGLK